MKTDNTAGWIQKLAGNYRARRWILILGIAGIALLFLSGFFGQNTEKEEGTEKTVVSSDAYAHQLEQNLLEIIRAITGEEDAQVMVTLESGAQQVYATEEKQSAGSTQEQSDNSTVRSESSDDRETSYILVKGSDGSQKALSVTELSPQVRGVVVVCGNGKDPQLEQDIINAVTTALQISSTRVCVVGRG